MEISFEIIKKSIFIRIFDFLFAALFIGVFIVLGVRFFFDSDFRTNDIYILIFMVLFLISSIPLFFKSLKYIKHGLMTFSNYTIRINDTTYEIEKLENICIFLDGYNGQLSFNKSHYSPISFFKDGGGNNISFIFKGTKLSFNFFVNYKYENDELIQIIDKWKEQFPESVKIIKY